jgi:hypothetical protein
MAAFDLDQILHDIATKHAYFHENLTKCNENLQIQQLYSHRRLARRRLCVLSFVAQGAAHAHHISPPLLCFFGFLSLYLLEYFMKHLSVLVKIWGSMLALLVGSAVHAQNAGGTVSFSGSLTANTCAFQMAGVTQSAMAVQ